MIHNNKQNINIIDPELNSPWSFGYVGTLKKKSNSKILYQDSIETICKFKTVKEFWWLMSLTVDNKKFPQNIIPKELWIFRDDCIPDWNIAKKYAQIEKLADISFNDMSKPQLLNLCMFCIGETLPDSNDILGLRIKKHNGTLNIRLWVKSQDSAKRICKAVKEELATQCNSLMSSIKMF